MVRLSPQSEQLMRELINCPRTRARFADLVHPIPLGSGCLLWRGAIAGQGHGRFWLGRISTGRNVTVIAHRWAFALHHNLDMMLNAQHIRHQCDNPICQNPAHLAAGEPWQNTLEGLNRRQIIGNPLRDIRGARGRALALRGAVLAGSSVADADHAGRPPNDLYQDTLPIHEWTQAMSLESTPIQAATCTEGRRRSITELARIVAHDREWAFDGDDQILDQSGRVIAWTIEDAAAAMNDLGWFAGNRGLVWDRIPASPAAAASVRERLDHGKHPDVNG